MRNNIAFRLSAQNSLRINEIPAQKESNLLNTFKGGSDLRSQLNKTKLQSKTIKVGKNAEALQKQQRRTEQQALAQEVAALDHFKAPVVREKTKGMIENIKLRRREKHIDTMTRFHEDLDDYKENLFNIYSSLTNDLSQVMSIKLNTMEDYFRSCENPQYLLSREKDLIAQINEQVMSYQIECQTKLNYSKEELERIRNSRGTIVADTCAQLREALIQIAFVLENEAREIQEKEKTQIQKIQSKYYQEYSGKAEVEAQAQQGRNQEVGKRAEQVIKKWKQTKEDQQIKNYVQEAQADQLRRPSALRVLYDELIAVQINNHNRKVTLMNNLIKEDPDTYSKTNIDKFNDQLKKINDYFDDKLDNLINLFITAKDSHKRSNDNRYEYLRNRMTYIENHTQEEIQGILKEKCAILHERNIKEQEQLMKNSTNYVQSHDDKENKVLGAFSRFMLKIGQQNDKFIKDFGKLNTDYQIEKAKILDNDEQLVQKLNEQLEKLKIQLKEALHHIKLSEVEKKCFEKVDEIQKAYRQCHENNKKLKETRTPTLQQFMIKYEAQLAQIMQLFNPSRRAELEEKNRKEAEERVVKMIELEDKKKSEEEARLIEEAKAKGGKPPAPAKPKDPKKAAAQFQQRKKALLAEIGPKQIQELKSDTGSTWLVFRSIEEICKEFYQFKEDQNNQNKQGEQKSQGQSAEEAKKEQTTKAIDAPDGQLKDCRGQPVVTEKAYLRLEKLIPGVSELRKKLFDTVASKRSRILQESEMLDEEMLDQSLTTLDTRLKAHYSLKGTIQSQIYVKRSGEITSHKKKYEKYARTIKDKMDLQTEKFNFLLEKGLQTLKQHNTEQKKMKEHIPKCKNLSQLQGMYSRARQNGNSFGMTIKEMYSELQRLSGYEVDILLQKNDNFIKESKRMIDGGDYSPEEIAWYEEMMGEVTKQMKEQQEKRKQKLEELRTHCDKRRKQLLEAFEKEYTLATEQTAAKDGIGKKYGRPKRIAQQKTRLEMNKCEQAQINIDKLISELGKDYQINMENGFKFGHEKEPPTLEWRRKLMTIQTCITRYGKHIEAFRPDLKIQLMQRVNYDENQPIVRLSGEEEEQKDKQRKQTQLKALGRLYEQKDERVFMKYIEQIEKIISDQSRTIYVGDKAKYLTGNDKIPDFLRIYIANMKANAQAFRISCIRDLRESCGKLADLSKCLSELIFSSILSYSKASAIQTQQKTLQIFQKFAAQHKSQRADHLKKLRPNLLNPKCQEQLKQLDKNQLNRKKQYEEKSTAIQKESKDQFFNKAAAFLNKLFNNFEFLLSLTNSFYLYEDFVKCPGDEIEQKNHLDIQRLMVMKQKGIKIDPTSERNLRRKWEGLNFTVFDIDGRKYEYKKINMEEQVKEKDKKAGKKDSKDPKKQQVEEPVEGDPNKSKTLETFKTWRQKSVFENRNRIYEDFKVLYSGILEAVGDKIVNENKLQESFGIKWRETADSLYLK